ncbi:MAG: T9SS type A sorting domain-containing protein [Flavobacteriales bacterium]|nr:T9SS type A sorting domain-containing protein [Flavobacteriales bacterium]
MGKVNVMGKSIQLSMLLTFLVSQLFGQQTNMVAVSEEESMWGEPSTTMDRSSRPSLELGFAPNPFAGEITVNLTLPESGKVSLKVFDILGQEVETVANEYMTEGPHTLKYLGSDLPAGRYYFHLSAGGKVVIKQVLKKN